MSSGVALFFFEDRRRERGRCCFLGFFFNSISLWLKTFIFSDFLASAVLGVFIFGLMADFLPTLDREVVLLLSFDFELTLARVFFFFGDPEASSLIVCTLARDFFLLIDGVFWILVLYRALLLGFINDLISAWEAICFEGIELTFFLVFRSCVLGTSSS